MAIVTPNTGVPLVPAMPAAGAILPATPAAEVFSAAPNVTVSSPAISDAGVAAVGVEPATLGDSGLFTRYARRRKAGDAATVSAARKAGLDLTPDERRILERGIYDLKDIATALEFLRKVSPGFRAMVDDMERLREERIASGETGHFEEAFAIKFDDGTYSMRCKFKNRKTELSDGIALRRVDSIFALIHELTHALPLEALPPELASMPYKDMDSLPKDAPFEMTYFRLIDHAYQDEAISALAEILLYDALRAAGVEIRDSQESKWLKEVSEVYERDGRAGFIRSEKYIGRNHRSDYNKQRFFELAFMAMFDQTILSSPGLDSILQDTGVKLEGQGALGEKLGAIGGLLHDPSPEKLRGFAESLLQSGAKIAIDVPTILSRIREAHALVSGERRKASDSFTGREKEARAQVGILARTRNEFEKFRQRFDIWWAAHGTDEEKWEDVEGILSFYGMAYEISQSAESSMKSDMATLVSQIEAVIRRSVKIKAIAELEIARIYRDAEGVRKAFRDLEGSDATIVDDNDFVKGGHDEIKSIDMTAIRCLRRAAEDPFVRQLGVEVPAYKLELFNLPLDGHEDAAVPRLMHLLAGSEMGRNVFESFAGGAVNETIYPWGVEALQVSSFIGGHEIKIGRQTDLISGGRREKFDINVRSPLDGCYYRILEDNDMLLRVVLGYQKKLKEMRGGQEVKVAKFSLPDEEENAPGATHASVHELEILYFLGCRQWMAPEGVKVFSPGPALSMPTAIEAPASAELMNFHLRIEQAERESKPDLKTAQDIGEKFVEFAKFRASLPENLKLMNASSYWIAESLGIRLARILARAGDASGAATVLDAVKELHASRQDSPPASYEGLFELTARLIPFWSASTEGGKKETLASILDEYETTVRLRRQGLGPTDIARLVLEIGGERDFRTETMRLIELATEHVATYDLHAREYQMGALGIIDAIHSAHLLHFDKEKLLTSLFESAIPGRDKLIGETSANILRRIRVFEWLKDNLLSPCALQSIAAYPGAEAVLFEKMNDVLREIGSSYLPPEAENAVLEVSSTLNDHVTRHHPEVVAEENIERLERVSGEREFNDDLADVFPSRRAVVDPSLPVEKWKPGTVRRGALDSTIAWERIRETLERDLLKSSDDEEFGRVLEVFGAHARERLESAVRHADAETEIKNIVDAYKKRQAKMGDDEPVGGVSASLTLYRSVLRLMDKTERVRFGEIAAIPSFEYVLGIVNRAFDEGRSLTAREEKLARAILTAPTLSDARRLRELNLAVIGDERWLLILRRVAARNLARASKAGRAIDTLIDGFENSLYPANEMRFYRTISNYWQRIGALPDDSGVFFIDEGTRMDEDGFWKMFDSVIGNGSAVELDDVTIQLLALKKGKFADRFVDETWRYISQDVKPDSFLFRDDIGRLFPSDFETRRQFIPMVRAARMRWLAISETAQMANLGLPAAFLKQPPVILRLLSLFIQNMPGRQTQSLLEELRVISETKGDAEVFNHFFLRTGLAKAGQFLSTLVGIVPDVDREVFKGLQDAVPASSDTEVRKEVEAAFGMPINEIFSKWHSEPVASASMGEVYRAILKDGRKVYVKVSPPTKRLETENAIAILLKVADLWEARGSEIDEPIDIARQLRSLAAQMKGQLNFMNEMRAARSFQLDGYRTPEFVDGLVTEHVAVMLPLPGMKVTKVKAGAQRKAAAKAYSEQALKMIISDGAYHADPHPANVFWDSATSTLSWLDFGVISLLRAEGRAKIAALFTAAAVEDRDAIVSALQSMTEGRNRDGDKLRREIAALKGPLAAPEKILAIINAAGSSGFYIEQEIMKAIAFLTTVRGVVHELDPERNFARDVFEAYAREGAAG